LHKIKDKKNNMSKVVRLTEKDLAKLVNKVIKEQSNRIQGVPIKKPSPTKPVDLGVPIDNPLYQELEDRVSGDGSHVIKYIPNKLLVIGSGFPAVLEYTITKH
jgi:hypothetical protein